MKRHLEIFFTAFQAALILYLFVMGIWRLNESGLDIRAFISFGLALSNLWFLIDRLEQWRKSRRF